ncbi:MAG: TMEM175 family protein [Rhodanobacteraceae bacterium]
MIVASRIDSCGFCLRGGENTLVEAFTDGAFAFALTLLVIGGNHVAENASGLAGLLHEVPAFAACFTLVCLFWYAHYIWFRRYGLEDRHSVLLSLPLVFLVLICVTPLHMMFPPHSPGGAVLSFQQGESMPRAIRRLPCS